MSIPCQSQVTVCECKGKLVQLGPNAGELSEFLRDFEGIVYPHLEIPRDLNVVCDSSRLRSVLREITSVNEAKITRESRQSSSKEMFYNFIQMVKALLFPNISLKSSTSSVDSYEQPFEEIMEAFKVLPKYRQIMQKPAFGLYTTSALIKGLTMAKQRLAQVQKTDSPVPCVAWHPYKQTFAFAHKNNAVFIYDLYQTDYVSLPLYHVDQEYVYCMEWRPYNGSTLAVGSRKGICLWNVQMMKSSGSLDEGRLSNANSSSSSTSSSSSRPSNNWMTLLSFSALKDIHNLSWSPCGSFLAASSLKSSLLVIWNVAKMEPIPFQLPSIEGSISSLSWSPENSFLFIGTTKPSLYLLKIQDWSLSRYEVPGIPQNAQWTVQEDHVIFSCHEDSRIYILSMVQRSMIERLGILYDFGESVVVDPKGESLSVGGPIRKLILDPKSSRLLVSFESTSNLASERQSTTSKDVRCGKELILVFDCQQNTKFQIFPIGFISGPKGKDKNPHVIDMVFAQSFDRGALALLAYSNGKLGFFPFLY